MLSQNGFYYKGKEKIFNPIIDEILKSRKKSFKLIDIGCGDGHLLKMLYKQLKDSGKFDIDKVELIGVDRYEGYSQSFNDNDGKIKFRIEDFTTIDKTYGENYFDFVVSVEVLEHVVETDLLIKKMKHILKPEGKLLLTTPNLASYHGRFSLLFGYTPLVTEVSNECGSFGKGFLNKLYSGNSTETVFHVRVFTYKGLQEFIKYHGFDVLSARGLDYKVPWLWKNLPFIAPIVFLVCEQT